MGYVSCLGDELRGKKCQIWKMIGGKDRRESIFKWLAYTLLLTVITATTIGGNESRLSDMYMFESTGDHSAISRRHWYGDIEWTAYGWTVPHYERRDKRQKKWQRGWEMTQRWCTGKRLDGHTKTMDRHVEEEGGDGKERGGRMEEK